MPNPELSLHSGRQIREKRFALPYILLVGERCPESTARETTALLKSKGVRWFVNQLRDDTEQSRRSVFMPNLPHETLVIKQKSQLSAENGLKLDYFTQSVIHELRAAGRLSELICELTLPAQFEWRGKTYQLNLVGERAVGAILNQEDPSERYTLFSFITGESVRSEVARFGGWEFTPEEKRKLFGRFHRLLCEIADQLVDRGLEPWDLGVHQLVYRFDDVTNILTLGILDTEEYSFSDKYGEHWTGEMRGQLPVILPFL